VVESGRLEICFTGDRNGGSNPSPSAMKTVKNRFKLEKRYYKLLNNFLGCVRNGLINENETKVMELEVRKAKKDLDNYIE
jgi:hypothetical protein